MMTTGHHDLSFLSSLFNPAITKEENHLLTMLPAIDEIKQIISSLNPGRVPGPDGFNGQFFKSCWDVVNQNIVSMVQKYFKGDLDLHAIKETYMILILKHVASEEVADFRPISLCNEVYKIVAKFLVSRIKLVIQKFITDE